MKEAWTKEKLISKMTDLSRAVLYVIAACILLWLNVKIAKVSGVLAALAAVFVSVGLGVLMEKVTSIKKQAEWIALGVCCLIFWGICMWWVFVVPYVMDGDQAIIWTASTLALENNFVMYGYGGQMFIYPQQQGLAFLYELLFRLTGTTSYHLIGYVNASLAPFTLFFGYQCVKECADTKAAVRFLPLIMLCLPYIIYSPYVYGDIPSICYSFILFWAVLKFTKTGKYRYGFVTCIAAAVALISRKNVWIFFIGLMIGLGYYAVLKWSWKPIILSVSFVLCAALSMTGIKQFNSLRSGYPVSSGMPTILWMAMGVQYSEYGAGHYNNYSKGVYEQVGFDNEAASAVGLQEVKDRIKVFLQYPDQCGMFFEEKISSQWTEPFFDSINSTGTFGDITAEQMHPAAASVYQGEGYHIVKWICEQMMFLVYFFAMIGVGFRYFKKKEILQDVPIIVVVGGFLFSIIWEAKARYMLPYYVLLYMYAAYGLTDVSELLKRKFLSRKE